MAAAIETEPVTYSAGDTTLRGFLATTATQQSRPGVLVVHEWWGLNDYIRRRARMLAELGYTALAVDMYGSRRTFKGRIAGFTMGTGSTLALLPAQNATGNFVKVVQRLPVRIELVGYDAEKSPLFIGTSVVPVVHIDAPATGPDAGKFLQARLPDRPAVSSAAAPSGTGK